MRIQASKTIVLLGLALSLGLGHAMAQAPASGTPAAKPALSPAAMVEEGEGVVEKGGTLSQTVSGLVREATEEADMMKVTCLNDKLTQIDGNLRAAQEHLKQLRAAEDAGVRQHAHTMIMVLGGKLDVLAQEASQCVGQDLYSTGETSVETQIDTDMLPFEDDAATPPTILAPTLPTLPPAITEIR
jgi:hypothetical protein